MRWTPMLRLTRAAWAYGESVWSWRPERRQASGRRKLTGGDGGNRGRLTGEITP